MHSAKPSFAPFKLRVCRPLAPGRICSTSPSSSWYMSASPLIRPWSKAKEASEVAESAKSIRNETDQAQSIVGTVPYHTSYTLLRHRTPPSTYPPKLDAAFSPLGRELTRRAAMSGGLVNFWWEGGEGRDKEDVNEGKEGEREMEERYSFLSFGASSPSPSSLRPSVRSGAVTTSHVDSFFGSLHDVPDRWAEEGGALLLVCTHGSRDCRCGDRGGAFVTALRAELDARRSQASADDVWNKIRIGEVAHVGGHKYAANMLAFPFGDWLGHLTPALAPRVLDAVTSRLRSLHNKTKNPSIVVDESELLAPLIADDSIWRGRMGLTKEQQVRLFESYPTAGRE